MANSGNNGDSSDESEHEPEAYHVHYDPESEKSISTVIVKAVSAVTGTPPTELDSLYETVDPEAIDTVYETINTFPHHDEAGHLTFTFSGCDLTVYWSGKITVHPTEWDHAE